MPDRRGLGGGKENQKTFPILWFRYCHNQADSISLDSQANETQTKETKMNERQKLAKLMNEADANATQASKDGRGDAAKQWRALAADYAAEIAAINTKRVKELMSQ